MADFIIINASDILLSMLFNLLLGSITILLCFFFLFLVIFNSFFMIPVKIKKARLKLALTIPTGVPVTVANDAIELLPVVTDKTIKNACQNSQKNHYIYLLISYLSLISATK